MVLHEKEDEKKTLTPKSEDVSLTTIRRAGCIH